MQESELENRANHQARKRTGAPALSPTQPEARKQKVGKEWLITTEMQQLDITGRSAVRFQREVPATTVEGSPSRQKFESAISEGDQATQRTIEKATIEVLYTRPVKRPIFTAKGCPPWFERLRSDLQKDNSSYFQPLQPAKSLTRQRPGRFVEDRLQSKNYARDPITLLPMGKDLLQRTRTARFVDSTIKSSYNANNTLMDVRLMNMLSEMAEATDKTFTPAAAELIPLPSLLVYSNVTDHFALQGKLRYFDIENERFTEGFDTDEVVAYVERMASVAKMIKDKKQPRIRCSCHPLGTCTSQERSSNSCIWC